MPNKRDLNLDEYEISRYRYRELFNFCLQYKELIAKRNNCYYIGSAAINGMPHNDSISNPSAQKAERAAKYSKDIELIEQIAIEAGGAELYQWFIKAVTENKKWEDLRPPCGRRQFYEKRRKFFYLLDLKKG